MQISGINEEKVDILFLLVRVMLAGKFWNDKWRGADDSDLFHVRDEACKVAEITTARISHRNQPRPSTWSPNRSCPMQEENSPVVGLWPDRLLMAEQPSVRVCGVDHVEVTPDERTVWGRERKLRILALWVGVSRSMVVASMELVVGACDNEPDEREQGKEHGRRT